MSVPSSSFVPKSAEIVGHRRRRGYKVLRGLVMVAVLGFVAVAGWKAIQDLRQQSAAQQSRISELKRELAEHESSQHSSPTAASQSIDGEDTTAALQRELDQLEGSRLTAGNLGWNLLFFASLTYGIGLIFSARYWHSCLLAFGHRPAARLIVAAHVLGQIGKYVPGKAMVILIRAAALHRHTGIGRVPAIVGVFVETLTMMACGATLAGIATLFIPSPWWLRGLAVCLAICAAVPTLPPLFHLVLNRLSKSRFGKTASFEVQSYDWRLMVRGWGWMTLTWLMIGSSFWMITLATPGASDQMLGPTGFATAAATIALAMVAGFLSLIPGGAGVRELVITALLAPIAGTGPALIAAVLARLIYLTIECLASGLSWLYLQSRPVSLVTAPATSPTVPYSSSQHISSPHISSQAHGK